MDIPREEATQQYFDAGLIEWRRLATVERWWRLVAFWAVTVAVAWGVAIYSARNPVSHQPGVPPAGNAVEALSAWDGSNYRQIAVNGYEVSAKGRGLFNFFPLYPGLSRLLGGIDHAPLAGILLSQFLALVCLMLMSVMAHGHEPRSLSREPGFWLLLSPFGFFMLAFYTESLFLFLTLLHYFAYTSRSLRISASAGILAGLTRPTAIALPAMLWVEAIGRWRRKERWFAVVVAGAAPAIGIGIYFAYVAWRIGDVFGYPHLSNQASSNALRIPLHPMAVDLRAWIYNLRWSGTTPLFDMVLRHGSTFAMLLLLFLARRRLPVSWLVYSAAVLLLVHSFFPIGVSSGRYELMLFPAYFALATTRLAKSRAWMPVAIGFAVLSVLSLYRFTTWRWIG